MRLGRNQVPMMKPSIKTATIRHRRCWYAGSCHRWCKRPATQTNKGAIAGTSTGAGRGTSASTDATNCSRGAAATSAASASIPYRDERAVAFAGTTEGNERTIAATSSHTIAQGNEGAITTAWPTCVAHRNEGAIAAGIVAAVAKGNEGAVAAGQACRGGTATTQDRAANGRAAI